LTAAAICLVFASSSAFAGSRSRSKQRHRWEGVAIGVGAAMLGSAILHDIHRRPVRPRVTYRPYCEPRPRYCPPRRRTERRGHWESKKVWVPPILEKTWNPGHYDYDNNWIPGKWIRVEVEPGYWKYERVWVSYR
ncbi:MAG: hypothetical protein GY757_10175, partial [bacterium]|nr:hypothetical protein [bacterium]